MIKRNRIFIFFLILIVILAFSVQFVFSVSPTVCGDVEVHPFEDCDDGADGDDGNQCYDDCSFTFCGDGKSQWPNGRLLGGSNNDGYEDCDDGANGDDTDFCHDNCTNTYCGDGVIQTENGVGVHELCEVGDLNGQTCEYRGYDGGDLGCTSECDFDESNCFLTPVLEYDIRFLVSDIENPMNKIELVENQFFTWQDVIVEITTDKVLVDNQVEFKIYNPAFNTTSNDYDGERSREGCQSDPSGKTVCSVSCDQSSGRYECTLDGKYTRLRDEIVVEFLLEGESEISRSDKINLGSCPYDSRCKGDSEETDSYWGHSGINIGYPDAALNDVNQSDSVMSETDPSCNLYEVCNPDLDKYIDEVELLCVGYETELGYRDCASNIIIEHGLGPSAWWMQSYWVQKINYKDSEERTQNRCIDYGPFSHLNPRNDYFRQDGTDEPTWKDDLDFTQNNCYFADYPAHVSLDIIKTGICTDYSIVFTTLMRKLGYTSSEVFSVKNYNHAYNLLRQENGKFKIYDLTNNKDQDSIRFTNRVLWWRDGGEGVEAEGFCRITTFANDNSKEGSNLDRIFNTVEGCKDECIYPNYGRPGTIWGDSSGDSSVTNVVCCNDPQDKSAWYPSGKNRENICCGSSGTWQRKLAWGRSGTIYAEDGANATSICCLDNGMPAIYNEEGSPVLCQYEN